MVEGWKSAGLKSLELGNDFKVQNWALSWIKGTSEKLTNMAKIKLCSTIQLQGRNVENCAYPA